MTQKQQIISYIKEFGGITPIEAFLDLGITKLATRISELKQEGFLFDQEMITRKNRYGRTVRYMEYRLIEGD